jgi:hypothetical protein
MTARPPLEILRPGHVFARVVPAGTTVFVARGQVRMEAPPQWLAERMHVPQHALGEGEAQTVAHTGWLALHAPADGDEVQVLLVPPRPWWQRLRSVHLRSLRWPRSCARCRRCNVASGSP